MCWTFVLWIKVADSVVQMASAGQYISLEINISLTIHNCNQLKTLQLQYIQFNS